MTSSRILDLLDKINSGIKRADLQNLSQIEYDSLMQHLRSLYEELYQQRKENAFTMAPNDLDKITSAIENLETEKLPSKKTFLSNQHLLLTDSQHAKKEPVEAQNKESISHRTETSIKPTEKPEKKQLHSSINENVTNTGSLNEKLKHNSGNEMHKKLSTKPLKDLIDLNKRFVLLTELFKSNAEAFSAAIHHIDSLDNYPAAETFIQSQLASNYYWDQSSQSARLFMKLVKQKFGVL